jgi:hypothetical protein
MTKEKERREETPKEDTLNRKKKILKHLPGGLKDAPYCR